MDSIKLQESRQKAREWADSFHIGERIEIEIGGEWFPATVEGKKESQRWPILRLAVPSHPIDAGGQLIYERFIWYMDRKSIRKLHETA